MTEPDSPSEIELIRAVIVRCGGAYGTTECCAARDAALARFAELREALEEAERLLAYFAGETDGVFAGSGTPQSCLKQIRAAIRTGVKP